MSFYALSGTLSKHEKTKIGYFGQMNIDRLNQANTVYQEVQSVDPHITETLVRRTCAHMMFSGDTADKKISVLSGGERSRVMLGKILLKPVNLLFLDEPTNHLDIEAIQWLEDELRQTKKAFILISHDRAFLRNLS